MAMTAKTDDQAAAPSEAPEKDSPLLDLSDAAVKKFIKTAKARGFVTLDALNAVLPSEEVSPDQIEDTMSMLSDMGITVVESEDPDEAAAPQDGEDAGEEEEPQSRAVIVSTASVPAVTQTRAEPTERTDDPVRMYLRDMGSVELLSREGEIAIAKRIEAGREAMIAGLCESPLTFQAVIIWRDELKDAKILLRDIIDLEATYEGPEAKAAPPPVPAAAGAGRGRAAAAPAPLPATAPKAATASRAPKARWRTTRTSRTRSRSPPWRPSSSPRCSRPSTTSPAPTRSCASCRTRKSRCRSRASSSRASSSAATTSCATRSSATSRACRSTTRASRAWWSSSTPSTSAWSRWRAG